VPRNVKLTVEYDGTPYKGWQRQPGNETIQGTLEAKLSDMCGHQVSLLVAGRTDAGVHALGQVCCFHTSAKHTPSEFKRILNQLLPHSIRVVGAAKVPARFHATYQAHAKIYRYIIRNTPDYTVFDRSFYHHVRMPLDVSAMRRAAKHFVGTKDFSSFRGPSGRERDPMRTLYDVKVIKKGPWVYLEFRGKSFLHQMVRILSGTLVYVGLGKIQHSDLPAIFESKDRKRGGPTLPPNGLFLVKVFYDRKPASRQKAESSEDE
jgi:tRNA pseudouridine38-40 synthase